MLEEGFRSKPYRDTRGFLTVGYGLNLDSGISRRVAVAALTEQLSELHETLLTYSWYATLDVVRQGVCLDMAFNLGLHGLMAFAHMIAAIERGDWAQAKVELLNSKAARELPSRYAELARLLLTGQEMLT